MPLSKNIVKLTNFSVNSINFAPFELFLHRFETILSVYLVNYVEILLHDHFSGCIEIANPLGSFFIPRGFAPWDEKNEPSGLAISMHPSK